MINLLVAEDHDLFIDGLRTVLKEAPDIVIKGTAKNGYEVLKQLKLTNYDVVLLDINMPEMNGIECAKKIRDRKAKTKVLILSQFGDKKLVDRLVNYDVNGYLLKNSSKEELLKAIREVHNNNKYFSTEIRSDCYFRSKIKSRFDYFKCEFSKREKQVLNLICDGFINSEIAEKANLSIHSVKTYRHRIMKKSGMRNTAELVKWVVENDLID